MYFSAKQIVKSIKSLGVVHPFHGITFLACKKAQLPVNSTRSFPMDSITRNFLLEHHKLDENSSWFFQPFGPIKNWVKHDYASSGLQAINTQTLSDAFIHERNTQIWGWSPDYVDVLRDRLQRKRLIPLFDLAVWIYKYKNWPELTKPEEIIDCLRTEYFLTPEEEHSLFDCNIPDNAIGANSFGSQPASWLVLREFLELPPDASPEHGGTLSFLELNGLGPADRLILNPGNRLTLITGDNGLGKTFLLECAWWALTGRWAAKAAYPRPETGRGKASIEFAIENRQGRAEETKILFDWKALSWPVPKRRPTIPGLIVYARVDGSFAVWDPIKMISQHAGSTDNSIYQIVFSSDDVWDGLHGRIEGLIRDWVRWQSSPSKYPFDTFTSVLAQLSPPEMGLLVPGEPVRIPDDPRDIPTIVHPYGVTPIVYASAGVKRIITLAYLTVWAWNEHTIAAELARINPERRLVVLVDEMEAHLHPKWQREVLPALMSIGEMLSDELEIQFIVATHSALVMASSESIFDENTDALLHLDLDDSGKVELKEIDYARFGDASSWLTSPVFDMKHARSREAEAAIEEAKHLQLQKSVDSIQVREISEKLARHLGNDDKFWPRWIAFAEKHGVTL